MNTKIIKLGLIVAAGIAVTCAIIWGVGHMKNTRANAGDDHNNTIEHKEKISNNNNLDNDDPDNNNHDNGKLTSEGKAITTGVSIAAAENDPADSVEATDKTRTYAYGPFGRIGIIIPEGWNYEVYDGQNTNNFQSKYGIKLWYDNPDEIIDIGYYSNFGVCGTGLKSEDRTFAGHEANVGTYDDHKMWDFVSFKDDYKGIAALNGSYGSEYWTADLKAQVEAILDTLSFEPGITEGAAYQFTRDAENTDIGMDFSLEDISPSGATFVYTFYEGIPAESRHIIYGDEYTIEKLNGTDWTAVLPVIDNLGFNDIAHLCINMDTFKDPIDWEYAFGKLEKGTYRVKKTFWYDDNDGNRKSCDVYAQFVIG